MSQPLPPAASATRDADGDRRHDARGHRRHRRRHPDPDSAAIGLWRALRYSYRVPMLLWHLCIDLPIVLLLLAPPLAGLRIDGARVDHRAIRAWSGGLLRVFGLRVARSSVPLQGPVLFVANHASWVDIVVLHSQRTMGLVAKREIAAWPLVGWLARRSGTIFHQRGSQESLGGVLHEMLARLRAGRAVGVFPEGRTRDGREVGPFHARIFLAAVEAGVPVQPVALCYGRSACAQTIVAFRPRENFLGNFLRLIGEPARVLEVKFLVPILPGDTDGRRRIAEIARERIVTAMQQVHR